MTTMPSHRHAVIIGASRTSARPAADRRAMPTDTRGNVRTPLAPISGRDFFPTPPEATRALLSVETFDGPIWEPACGEGAIASELTAAGHEVVSTDLHAYGFGLPGIDFLTETTLRAKHIVTNPPYGKGLADAFLLHALALTRLTRGKVALLLNLASLSHSNRTKLWRAHPPARLYAMDGIVCWPDHRYGPVPAHFTKHRYVWAVWEPGVTISTTFAWLSAHDFR